MLAVADAASELQVGVDVFLGGPCFLPKAMCVLREPLCASSHVFAAFGLWHMPGAKDPRARLQLDVPCEGAASHRCICGRPVPACVLHPSLGCLLAEETRSLPFAALAYQSTLLCLVAAISASAASSGKRVYSDPSQGARAIQWIEHKSEECRRSDTEQIFHPAFQQRLVRSCEQAGFAQVPSHAICQAI